VERKWKALLVKIGQKLSERVGDATRFERSENRVYAGTKFANLPKALIFAILGQVLSHLICLHWIFLPRALLFAVFGQLLSHQICHHWISLPKTLLFFFFFFFFFFFASYCLYQICHHWISLPTLQPFSFAFCSSIFFHFFNFLVIFHDETSFLFHSNIQSWQMRSLPILDPYVFLVLCKKIVIKLQFRVFCFNTATLS